MSAFAKRRGAGQRGLTLVETMLGMTVGLLGSLGLYSAYYSTASLSRSTGVTIVAIDDLRDMMEHIRATAFTALWTTFPHNVPDGQAFPNDYASLIGGYQLTSEQITVQQCVPSAVPGPCTLATATTDPVELIVTITWSDQGRARTFSLSTVRSGVVP